MRALLLICLLAACTKGAGEWVLPDKQMDLNAALEKCCAGDATYPDWLVNSAVKEADWIVPIVRGMVLRPSYLAGKPDAWDQVLDGARPLDMVLIANKSRLSGSAGEGYFGHSALYLGGKAELRRLGLWNDPLVVPHRALFEAGAVSVEAIDGGVRLSRPAQLFEADAAAHFRVTGLSSARKRQVIRWLLARLGRPFDNRFDLNDPQAYYCTELIHAALPEMGLPVTQSFGRSVVWPDEVAASSLLGKTGFKFTRYVQGDKHGWRTGTRHDMGVRVVSAWTAK